MKFGINCCCCDCYRELFKVPYTYIVFIINGNFQEMEVAKVDHCNFLFTLVHCYFLRIATLSPSPIDTSGLWTGFLQRGGVPFGIFVLCLCFGKYDLMYFNTHFLTLQHKNSRTLLITCGVKFELFGVVVKFLCNLFLIHSSDLNSFSLVESSVPATN